VDGRREAHHARCIGARGGTEALRVDALQRRLRRHDDLSGSPDEDTLAQCAVMRAIKVVKGKVELAQAHGARHVGVAAVEAGVEEGEAQFDRGEIAVEQAVSGRAQAEAPKGACARVVVWCSGGDARRCGSARQKPGGQGVGEGGGSGAW
jgi:hypothetical protein